MWVDFSHTEPIKFPYGSHIALPMWVQHGTMLQIPHESLMGCPYRTHINTHLGPIFFACWVVMMSTLLQYNLNGSNTDGSFTVDDLNSFFSPYKILPIAQEI